MILSLLFIILQAMLSKLSNKTYKAFGQKMKKILIASLTALVLLAPVANAQENLDEEKLGLSCSKILGMKYESWTQFYSQKKGGWSEVSEDIAAEVYAECMKQRNDVAIAKLPGNIAQRIKAYRQHSRQYGIASTYLQQAYAGGVLCILTWLDAMLYLMKSW